MASEITTGQRTQSDDEQDDTSSTSQLQSNYVNSSGPSVLILGGCGFIGRHLVEYLAINRLTSKITIADKTMPILCHLSKKHLQLYKDKSLVQCLQVDLTKDVHIDRVFKPDVSYDYIFNLCGETRFGLSEKEYTTKCVESAQKCVKAAIRQGEVQGDSKKVKKWIEMSTAQVYQSNKSASNETSSIKPWTLQATKRLEVEQIVRDSGLPFVILRPALVYGIGDLTSLTPRLSSAAVYQERKEKMQFLWSDDLRMNVVHVDDVAEAMWITATECTNNTAIYNLSDEEDLTQGKFNKILSQLFHIDVSCIGSIMSAIATKLSLSDLASDANELHVPVWTKLCQQHNINVTPITPYIDKELLRDNHLSVDGRLITKETRFRYRRPFSLERVKEQLNEFIESRLFPPVLVEQSKE